MTDAEIEALREEMCDQRSDVRAYLEGVDTSSWDDETGDAGSEPDRDPVDPD